jgi:PHP family Zn ribbon phosphoesterase
MSHRTTFVYTRPNTSVAWYAQPASYAELFKTELLDTGKIILSAVTYSADNLTKTHQATWLNDADRIAWVSRETTQAEINNRIIYNAENNITLDIVYDDV